MSFLTILFVWLIVDPTTEIGFWVKKESCWNWDCNWYARLNSSWHKQDEPYDGLTGFLSQNNLHYESISSQEFQKLKSQLEDALRSQSNETLKESLDASHFFKVPFQKVLDLVQKRKVFMYKGAAYVHKSDLLSLVLAEFR